LTVSPFLLARGGHDASFQSRRTFCATGRPVQALLNTLIVKTARASDSLLPAWQPPGFTRCVAFRSPNRGEVLQANPALPGRQPLGAIRFSQLRAADTSPNSLNLNHLRDVVKRRFRMFTPTLARPLPFERQPIKLTPLPRGVNPSPGARGLSFSSGVPKINRTRRPVNRRRWESGLGGRPGGGSVSDSEGTL
jgi:hypothetical protein